MILWTIKLISSVRRAIAGRQYPHQMAWAVAFGLLLGVVPHGNLLAIGLLLVVLSLKINHALAGLTAIGATFVATKLDPYSHEVGNFVLTHPGLNESVTTAWQLPLVPWTDLNNTVVMGSFVIGVAALVPVFVITYPVFRIFASAPESDSDHASGQSGQPTDARQSSGSTREVILVDQGHGQVAPPHRGPASTPDRDRKTTLPLPTNASPGIVDFVEVDRDADLEETDNRIAVETRIDVIRMKDHSGASSERASQTDASDEQQPMDEALNYLLRQLRDSQQRKAA